MGIYSRLYVDESIPRIDSGRHNSSDFDDAMARILDIIICKNMNVEEMMAIFDAIKSTIKQESNACYDLYYLSDLKRRIERSKLNDNRNFGKW